MKIGRFSEVNNVSIDAVRHYMDLGLIIPEKQGGQYNFDAKCQKDLEDIMELKSAGFVLNEIKKIFLYKSFGKLTPYQENLYYKAIFLEKLKKIEEEMMNLSDTKDRLEDKIKELSDDVHPESCISGIGLKSLDIFRCSKCRGELILSDGTISSNQVIDGRLRCACGKEYKIESGILMAGTPYEESVYKYDANYIPEYINLTDDSYLNNLHKSLEWGYKKFKAYDWSGKVVLELGTGIGFFLRSIYEELPDNCVYLAVDHSIERQRFLKSILDSSGRRKNIIYICSDFLDMPVRDRCADVLLDISGTSNYSFEHEDFLLRLMDHYVKEKAALFGSYILFKNFCNNGLIDKKYRLNFIERNIMEKIKSLGFEVVEELTSDYVEKGGEHENFFVEGEKVYTCLLHGER